MANNRELSQFGSLVEVTNEASSIKVGLADASVGIGTTNPTEKLEVHGNIKVVDGSINVGASATFTQETNFSSGVGIADSIFHIGNDNTQIRFPAANTFTVETAGSERLRVDSSGRLGIGSHNNSSYDAIAQNFLISDELSHAGMTIRSGGSGAFGAIHFADGVADNTEKRAGRILYGHTGDFMSFHTANAERLRIGSNGYASIGNGAQGDELFHVGSASSLSPAIKVENSLGSLIIGRRQTNRFGIGTEGHVIQSDGDDFAIGTSDGEDFTIGTNNEKRITVKSNGRVGIGTDDPDELLEVLGLAQAVNLKVTGIGTFQNLKVSGDLTVEGTTTTLDTTLIDVDRIEVGANSDSIVAVAVTQSGKADILKFFNNDGTEVLGVTTSGNVTIQNTDTGSSAAPELTLLRTSASPANADYLGQIKFAGINSTGGQKNYAKITGKILDTGSSNGTEDGIIEFAHIKAGSQNISARFRSDSLQLLNGTAFSVAGDITANGNIQGDGSTNISSINDITAGGNLTIDGVSDLDELVVAGVSTFNSGGSFTGRLNVGASDLNNRAINAINTSTTAGAVSANNHNANGILFQGYNSSVDANNASFVVESDGSTGIGTGVAGAALHVLSTDYPTAKITRNHAVNYPALLLDNLSGRGCHLEAVSDDPGGGFRVMTVVGTARTERLRILGSGRVNIGQASDVDHTLCVAGTDATTSLTGGHNQGIQLQNKSTDDGTYSQIEWRTAAGGRYARIAGIQDDANGNGGQLVFLTETTGGTTTEALRCDSSQNVILGTNTAATSSKLTIRAASPHLSLYATPGTNTSQLNMGDTDDHDIGNISYRQTDNAMRFTVNATERLCIASNGNTGINTTTPDAPLEIQGDGGTNDARITFTRHGTPGNNATIGELYYRIGDDSVAGMGAYRESAIDDAYLAFFTQPSSGSYTERFRITSEGKVGINSTSPAVKLDIRATDAIRVPVGTTGQRPTGAAGYIRYNSSIASYEGHNGSEWAGIGGAAEVETSVSSTTATTCESFAKASYRSASIVAQITQGSDYQVGNYLLIHDGTTVTLVEESAVATNDMLGSFTATISGSNVVFQVNMATASAATVTTKMTKVSIP